MIGINRQEYYRAIKWQALRKEQAKIVVKLVQAVRIRLPRLGGKKLYHLLKKELQELKNENVRKEYIKRGQYFKNIFNPSVGFMQSKMNGGWSYGFDPSEVNFNFTEANSWQYSMFAPQDISGLIELYGGAEKFESKLDELFETEMELSGRHQVDITGLIGQYAHGNEPSHHMAYLYNYIGKPWKTQEKIHQILTEQYWNGAPYGK